MGERKKNLTPLPINITFWKYHTTLLIFHWPNLRWFPPTSSCKGIWKICLLWEFTLTVKIWRFHYWRQERMIRRQPEIFIAETHRGFSISNIKKYLGAIEAGYQQNLTGLRSETVSALQCFKNCLCL
jgi:hypothetical protein